MVIDDWRMFPPAPHVDLPLFLRFVFHHVSVWVSAVPSEAGEGAGSLRPGVTGGVRC